jgi:hypothetical protein
VQGRSIRVARIAGIPVGISPLWLVIVALITWAPGLEMPARSISRATPRQQRREED